LGGVSAPPKTSFFHTINDMYVLSLFCFFFFAWLNLSDEGYPLFFFLSLFVSAFACRLFSGSVFTQPFPLIRNGPLF